MRVVITGGAGFIGGNLARRLAETPQITEVIVLDDLSTGSKANLVGVDASFVEGSILDRALLREVIGDADAVVHLAADASVTSSVQNPMATHDVNTTGTVNVLEEIRRSDRAQLIFASSSAIYGEGPVMPKHEDLRPEPVSPYAVSKLAGESYVSSYVRVYGLKALSFRFFNVFGPLQPSDHPYAAAVPAFVDRALAGKPLQVFGDGEQTRDFVFVGSVARTIEQAILRGLHSPEPVNLASGQVISLNQLLRALERVLGRGLEVDYQPPRPGDIRHSGAEVARLHELFPDIGTVDLDEGLRQTVDWFRSALGPWPEL